MNTAKMTVATTRRWVVMGVSGSGKSTLGRLLAEQLQCRFVEGDDEHPAANVDKMRSGQALSDADRLPWLLRLQSHIGTARKNGDGLVLTCSALKHAYRDLLRSGDPGLTFLHLQGDLSLLEGRLRDRRGHFMPPALLASQLRDLEPLAAAERGLRLDIAEPPEQLMRQIFQSCGEK